MQDETRCNWELGIGEDLGRRYLDGGADAMGEGRRGGARKKAKS